MYKTTLKIEGMACGMCESHINDVIRNNFTVKRVSSSYKREITEIISEQELSKDELSEAIANSGYKLLSVISDTYEKKRMFGKKK